MGDLGFVLRPVKKYKMQNSCEEPFEVIKEVNEGSCHVKGPHGNGLP